MSTIDPKEFGEMVGAVKANSKAIEEIKEAFKGHKTEMNDLIKEAFSEIKQVIKDHMKEEEKDNDEQNERLAAIEGHMGEQKWFWDKLKWVMEHPKTSWFLFATACVAGIITFGYIFPELSQMLYNITNGRVDLTSFLAWYLENPRLFNS